MIFSLIYPQPAHAPFGGMGAVVYVVIYVYIVCVHQSAKLDAPKRQTEAYPLSYLSPLFPYIFLLVFPNKKRASDAALLLRSGKIIKPAYLYYSTKPMTSVG